MKKKGEKKQTPCFKINTVFNKELTLRCYPRGGRDVSYILSGFFFIQ